MKTPNLWIASLLLLTSGICPTAAASTSLLEAGGSALVVKFREDRSSNQFAPENVLKQIEAANRKSMSADFALYSRLGSPTDGQWLITERLPDEQLAAVRRMDSEHPYAYLHDYVILTYHDAATRAAVEKRLREDPSIAVARANVALTQSFRVNDAYVATTTIALAPSNYQWALESLNAMSPSSNPYASSGWDNAKGYGFVAVIDSGIDTTHPDLQSKIRFHFSQAFYPPDCTGGLTDIDEQGASSTCQNTYKGHGTHVSGLVAAVPQNSAGISGACWWCSLIVAKVAHNNVIALSSAINGITHAIIRGAPVIN